MLKGESAKTKKSVLLICLVLLVVAFLVVTKNSNSLGGKNDSTDPVLRSFMAMEESGAGELDGDERAKVKADHVMKNMLSSYDESFRSDLSHGISSEADARKVFLEKLSRHGEDATLVEKLVSEWRLSLAEKEKEDDIVSSDSASRWIRNAAVSPALGGGGGHPFDLAKGTEIIYQVCVRSGALIDAVQVQFSDGSWSPQRGGGGGSRHCFRARSGCISSVFVKHGALVDGVMFGDTVGPISPYYGGYGGSSTSVSNANTCLYKIHVRTGSLVDQMRFYFKTARVGYSVTSLHSHKVMEIRNGNAGLGQQVVQWQWHNLDHQKWAIDPNALSGQGWYPVQNFKTKRYWDIYGHQTHAGARLIQWAFHGQANQKFRFEPLGGDVYRIRPLSVGRYLDVHGWSTLNNALIHIWNWHGGNNQRWWVRPVYMPQPCGPRVRKDWEDLTAAEQTLYLNAFRQLRTAGKLEFFTKEHIEAARSGFDGLSFHGNSAFLPWHRYFIWELEEQIRKLGGAYRCFTLPYWDWSRGAGQTVANNPVWDTTIMGGNGGPCVTQGLVSQSSGYVISTVNGGGCLRRTFRSGTNYYQTTAQSMQMVETAQSYVSFRGQLEGRHNMAHVSVGGHLTSTSTATDDPVFYMLHCYVDMLWALRSDCHNYNQVNSPNDNNIYPTSEMNGQMSYPELKKASWAYISSNTISVSSLLRTTSAQWGYTYSGSNMRARSGMAMSGCTWNEIPAELASEVDSQAVRPDGLGKIAHLVNMDVRRKKAEQDKMSDDQIAAYACKRMQELEVKLGHKRDVCKYTERLQKCGSGPERANIPLSVILNKRGIKGNACLEKARKDMYAFAKETGTLRGLCNGLMDPVCPGSGNGALFDEETSSQAVAIAKKMTSKVRDGEEADEVLNARSELEARQVLLSKLSAHGEDALLVERLVSEWKLSRAKIVGDSQSLFYVNQAAPPARGGGGGGFHRFWRSNRNINAVCVRSGALLDSIQVRFSDGVWSARRGGNGGGHHCWVSSGCISSVFIKTGSLVDGILFGDKNGAFSPYYGGYGGGGAAMSNQNMCLYRIDLRSGSLIDQMRFFFRVG